MANNGYQQLGYLLGGGAQAGNQNAFMQGQITRANVDHLSAVTQEALDAARLDQLRATQAQDEETARNNLADAILKSSPNITPEQANAYATIMRGGFANFAGMTTGRGNLQTQDFRTTLGDPNADPNMRLAASSAIQGKLQSPFATVPSESVNLTAPADASGAPIAHETPLGNAIVGEHEANQVLRNAQAKKAIADAGAPELKVPIGYQLDPSKPGSIMPIPGGPKDPNAPQSQGVYGHVYMQRVLESGNQAVTDIQNLVNMPTGASAGVMGIGSSPGKSIFQSSLDSLRNSVSSQEVQDYSNLIAGIEQNLASIEQYGMRGSQAFSSKFNSLALREGDTGMTKLGKLAQLRQIVEKGLEPVIIDNSTPQAQKDFAINMVDNVKKAIPFTRADVIALANKNNPQATLADLMQQKGLSNGNATSGPKQIASEADYDALPSGTEFIDPNGVHRRKP